MRASVFYSLKHRAIEIRLYLLVCATWSSTGIRDHHISRMVYRMAASELWRDTPTVTPEHTPHHTICSVCLAPRTCGDCWSTVSGTAWASPHTTSDPQCKLQSALASERSLALARTRSHSLRMPLLQYELSRFGISFKPDSLSLHSHSGAQRGSAIDLTRDCRAHARWSRSREMVELTRGCRSHARLSSSREMVELTRGCRAARSPQR